MDEINLSNIFRIFLKRLPIILLTAVFFAAVTFCCSEFYITPIYKAQAKIIVSNGTMISGVDEEEDDSIISKPQTANKVSASDITSSVYLAESSVEYLKTPDMYKRVAKKLGYQESDWAIVEKSVDLSLAGEDTMFIVITARNSSSEEAKRVVNAFASEAPYYLKTLSGVKSQAVALAENSVFDSPKTFTYTLIAFFAGGILCLFAAWFIDEMDTTVKNEDELRTEYNIPVLGVVPDFESKSTNKKSRGKN